MKNVCDMLRAVAFDVDGVLIDSNDVSYSVRKRLRNSMLI